ncbi:MAG: GNAT family N-acetyltransferase [Thermodesulfovibrionia bacterium]|nr:GNAT family N-acetyltransferase [Thermodesulfovibrionia bacterium]
MKIDKGAILLEDEKIFLRVLTIEDITEDYINGLNDDEVNRYLVNVRINAQTRESVEGFIRTNTNEPSSVFLGIFIKDEVDSFIGTLRISGIDLFHYLASVGICIFDKRSWKKGYAVRSLGMVKEYLFNSLGLHYIEAGVYSENISSLKLFKSAGFTESHRLKDKFRHINSFEEVIIFKALNPSFDNSLLK